MDGARHNPADIRIHDRVPVTVGKSGNRARRVRADSRKGQQLVNVTWNDPSVIVDESDRAGVKAKRAARVPEPSPRPHRVTGGHGGEVSRGGPSLEPCGKGFDDASDRCLLEHDLADEDAPRAKPFSAPRQIPGIAQIPLGDGPHHFIHRHYSRLMAGSAAPRSDALTSIADEILSSDGQGRAMVAVDGRHGAGQAHFAEALAERLTLRNAKVFCANIDDFFRPRADREREGWLDGAAHYREAYDYSLLRRVLVDPFHTAGSTGFVLTGFDEERDQPVFQPKWMSAGPDAILIIAGVFLHRPELSPLWNYSVWLSAPASDSDEPEQARNIASDEIYLAAVTPSERASAIIDNSDPRNPLRVFPDSR